ncbi:hypothetical protein HYC85_013146 [Camellia sinensis]|uniref:ABC transporter domain-containing protein n=1 Tax=Camellia sinensis TaxID=4442 RepID=A0A7J7H2K9_CAMSI|nr:hypothetical protein HYC85_013146 [Camellia sinensis]
MKRIGHYIAHISDSSRYVSGIDRYGREIHSHRYTDRFTQLGKFFLFGPSNNVPWWLYCRSRATEKVVYEFFAYCGEVEYVEIIRSLKRCSLDLLTVTRFWPPDGLFSSSGARKVSFRTKFSNRESRASSPGMFEVFPGPTRDCYTISACRGLFSSLSVKIVPFPTSFSNRKSCASSIGDDLSQFVGPVLLNHLLQSVGVLCEAQYYQNVLRVGFRLRSTLQICQQLHGLWSAPFRIIIAMVLLYQQLGAASLPGSLMLALMFPIQTFIISKMRKLSKEGLQRTDKRVGLMNEILAAMDTVKYSLIFARCYAWEESFQSKVHSIRFDELSWFQKAQLLSAAENPTLANINLDIPVESSCSCWWYWRRKDVFYIGNDWGASAGFMIIHIFNEKILSLQVRENILFGSNFEPARYWKAIDVTALQHDLDLLPVKYNGRDLTEIGERGVNISGGQKQRVSMARAVYSNADVYIFDDPLSALDAHVGRQVFNNCIKGELQGKTRVLVTNQLHFLPQVDKVILISEGMVKEEGTFEELSRSGTLFKKLMESAGKMEEHVDEKEYGDEMEDGINLDYKSSKPADNGVQNAFPKSVNSKNKRKEGKSVLIKQEERETGVVSWKVLKR